MKSTRGMVLAFVITVSVGSAASGQKAPPSAPTVADWEAIAKLPDFTGVWEVSLGGGNRAAAPAAGNRGAGAPAGPSLTPAYAAKRDAIRAAGREDNETANCLPPGMPGIMNQPYPMEFLLTPGMVTIVIEAYTQVRHIYTGGRPLPEDPDLTFQGTSIGHWEGDTFVAETVGFSPLTYLASGVPHSDKMRIVERFKLADPDTMTIETTITDPEALTKPYTSSRILKRHRSWTVAEYICEENNRNFVDEKGKAGVTLGNPGGLPQKKD